MYGYAKRPRTRAANRLSRPDTPFGETKSNSSMITWRRIGLEFIDENGGGPGVRLKSQQREKAASKAQMTPLGETKPNSSMITWRLEFIGETGGGPGVRLKKSTKGKGQVAIAHCHLAKRTQNSSMITWPVWLEFIDEKTVAARVFA